MFERKKVPEVKPASAARHASKAAFSLRKFARIIEGAWHGPWPQEIAGRYSTRCDESPLGGGERKLRVAPLEHADISA